MEIRIGVTHSPKEISLEMGDEQEELVKKIEDSLNQDTAVLWLTDQKGKRVGIPCNKLAYVEMDPQSEARSVGFAP